MGFDRVQLKQSAKQAMRNQRPRPMLITLLFIVLVGIGSEIVGGILGTASGSSDMTAEYAQAVLRYEDPASAIQYVMLSFGPQQLALALSVGVFLSGVITSLWEGFMQVGYANFCLGTVRRQQPQTGALFSHFPRWAGVLLTTFLAGLFRSLWSLLLGAGLAVAMIVSILLLSEIEVLLALLMVVFYVAFLLGLVWIFLRYAMVDFVVADQGLTGMDAIRESKRLVRENGNTGRLFILELSFIGWYLLEALLACAAFIGAVMGSLAVFGSVMGEPLLPAGVGVIGLVIMVAAAIVMAVLALWLRPYTTGAEALFYDWARGVDVTHPSAGVGGDGGWGQPAPPQEHYDYTWNSGSSSGSGTGSGTAPGSDSAPRFPKPPKDDPWK